MNRFETKMRELRAIPIDFHNGEQPVRLTEEQIQERERIIEVQLPEDYREFVRDFGGFSLNAIFPVREGSLSKAAVGYFLGIMPDESYQTFDWMSQYLSGDPQWFPSGAINIAMSGNLPTFLFIKGEKKGKVYIRDYDDFCLVADSFEEFMGLLQNEFNEPDMEVEGIEEDAAPFWNSFSTSDGAR